MKLTADQLKLVQTALATDKVDEANVIETLCNTVTALKGEGEKLAEKVTELSSIPKPKTPDKDILLSQLEVYDDRVGVLVEKGVISKAYGDRLSKAFRNANGEPNVTLLSRQVPGDRKSAIADMLLSLIADFESGVNSTEKAPTQVSRQVPTDMPLEQNPLRLMAGVPFPAAK